MTQTLPDAAPYVPRNGRHKNLNTMADELRRIADILDRTYALDGTIDAGAHSRIADTTLIIGFQVDSSGPFDDVTTTIEILSDALHGVDAEYDRGIGFYRSPAKLEVIGGSWLKTYADMSKKAPSRVLAIAWDEAHAEQDERRKAFVAAEEAAADRLQDWFDAHKDCCTNGGYRALIDDEHHMAIEWLAEQDAAAILDAVDALDPTEPVITCGRCAIATGAHTFGIGCLHRLAPVPVFVAPAAPAAPAAVDHIHTIYPTDVAPGEPDDRGWDAPIVVSYVDHLGASA